MRPIRYTVLAVRFPSPKKKFVPSLTGDINSQSSHWINGKMKIVFNSAYVQIEIPSILPSRSKPVLCTCISIFVSASKKSLRRMPTIRLCHAHCRRVQSLSRRYATSTPQCHCHVWPIRYIADTALSPKQEICPFPNWRYKPQSSHSH